MRGWRLVLPLVAPWLTACPAAPTTAVPVTAPAADSATPTVEEPPPRLLEGQTGELGPGDVAATGLFAQVDLPTRDPGGSLPTKGPGGRMPNKGTGQQLEIGTLEGLGTGLGREAVQQVLRQQNARLRSCYDRLQLALPEPVGGTVSVRFHVEPAGTVSRTEIAASTITDPTFLECLRDVVNGLRFPTTDAPTIINYPFRFETAAGEE